MTTEYPDLRKFYPPFEVPAYKCRKRQDVNLFFERALDSVLGESIPWLTASFIVRRYSFGGWAQERGASSERIGFPQRSKRVVRPPERTRSANQCKSSLFSNLCHNIKEASFMASRTSRIACGSSSSLAPLAI